MKTTFATNSIARLRKKKLSALDLKTGLTVCKEVKQRAMLCRKKREVKEL